MDWLYDEFLNSTGVSTDSRLLEKGKIFFALNGENFNGNSFAEEALRKGASLVVADEQHFPDNAKIILVDDVLTNLQQLAAYHRKALTIKVIAVAGSNGKTTTKELIARVLNAKFKAFATRGNFNNHIGVPLTLLSIRGETDMAVIEMGANHPGETALLCEIVQPDYGLITNNGMDHLEGYGSIEGVRKGNGELFDFLRKKEGTAFVCADQSDLMRMSEGMKRYTYGKSEGADCKGKIEALFPFLKIQMENEGMELSSQLIGQYNFDNIMAAVATGKFFGVPDEKIQEAIASYRPGNNRSQLLQQGSNTFILDAYNANPSSMKAALENFSLMPAENKVAILGDMLELGTVSLEEHTRMIEFTLQQHFNMVLLVGQEFGHALHNASDGIMHFRNVRELKQWFELQHFSGYTFLLKGSRLIGLERLIEH